ncbi:MAG TPA: aconitase X catalytic domain-containing protein [Candidatus Sulfopaludibacter sp.]|nr:aconitase X catalytic domain-containing protein [Candidatus Sulfopaludibacter sp.]
MDLTREEEKAIAGEYGEANSVAYRILVAIGEATNAQYLIPIEWAHVSGVNYNTIGDSGLDFLKKISKDGKVKIKTSLNPMGFDRKNIPDLSDDFIDKQFEITKMYEKMGITPTFSCIPYEILPIPSTGTHVSFAESSAAVLANSYLKIVTNKESALSALASAIVGKTPFSDLRNEENRNPNIEIVNESKIKSELDFGLLGYFIGKTMKKSCTGLCNIPKNTDFWGIKSLSAGIGTSGSCGMFQIKDSSKNNEKICYGDKEMEKTKDELNTSEDGQIITFGSPQLGMEEICKIATLMQGRKFTKPCKIFCPRPIFNKSEELGISSVLQKSGVEFVCDACTCLTPLIKKENYDSIITNSVKAAYYMKTSNKISVALKDVKTIVKDYSN